MATAVAVARSLADAIREVVPYELAHLRSHSLELRSTCVVDLGVGENLILGLHARSLISCEMQVRSAPLDLLG